MIYKLDIRNASKTPVPWLPRIEALARPRTFEFKPGINILWGRNGSGKSSLIKVLARLFHCEQGNHPLVTKESLADLVGGNITEAVDLKAGVSITHDGQGVRHFDPGHAVGLMGGQFDWNFGVEGVQNAMFKGSAGQTTMFRFDHLVNEIVDEEVPKVEWKFDHDRLSGMWKDRVELADHFLEGTAAKGQPTILLDEPERSYDLNAQIGVWRFMRAYADEIQFIVASHALFALKIPDAHYIELSPGYMAGSERVLAILEKWSEEKPKKPSKTDVKATRTAEKKKRERDK